MQNVSNQVRYTQLIVVVVVVQSVVDRLSMSADHHLSNDVDNMVVALMFVVQKMTK